MEVDVKHIAELSRISLTEDELKEFTPQMEQILSSASVLQELDTEGIKPMKDHVPFTSLREDIPQDSITQEEALKNAPKTENGCIKIYGKIFGANQG